MIKLLTNTFDFGEPHVSLISPKRALVKSASEEMRDFLKTVRAEDGKTKLLVLAMGAGETYGPNRNGDWFSERELLDRHHTFEKYAKLYKHHVNKDPAKSYGDVEKSAYNRKMRRVELVVSVDNHKAPDVVKKANSGEDIPVSMSCRVPHDICSICDNKASRIEDYCSHLKSAMSSILPDGRQVCAINPNPTFFDISVVYKPADRIAYVLEKVASDRLYVPGVPSAYAARALGLTDEVCGFTKLSREVSSAYDLLKKLAAIEKQVEGVLTKAAPETKEECFISHTAPKALIIVLPMGGEASQALDVRGLLGSLADRGVILSPKEFGSIVSPHQDADISSLLPGIFSELLHGDGVFDLLGKNPFSRILQGATASPRSILDRLTEERSLLGGPAGRRILRLVMERPPKTQVISFPGGGGLRSSSAMAIIEKAADRGDLRDFAVGYALYKVAAIQRALAAQPDDQLFSLLAVLQNYVV